MDKSSPSTDFSIVQGGPLFKCESKLHLVQPDRASRRRCMFVFIILTWLPIPLLALAQGGTAPHALFSELQVHTQLLVAMTVLIAAEPYVDRHTSRAARQFRVSHLVGVGSRPALEDASRAAMRWRDSSLAEGCLLLTAFALVLVTPHDHSRAWMFNETGGAPSPAGWWYMTVSQPLVRFLALRWVWRAVVWARFLFRVSRLPLALVPTHPDQAGGLGFLAISQSSFAPVVFALSAGLAAYQWRLQPHGVVTDPLTYAIPQVVLGGLLALAVYAPLGLFTPQLVKAKRRGDIRFSALAAWHSRRFERKWFRDDASGEVLGAPDFSSLIDLGSSFVVARKMRLFPFDTRSLAGLLAAALAPLAILLIMDREFISVLKQIHDGLP
ncbi:hypothetical protein [Pyxidicoccus caerfyrddinensis]|uniref:hypothetical protein n=1 Tax=Pyxidicoccus caerfyrddinensis TaxID=2709663 RepID=UPI0013D8F012|nr:hypothetical protein [Pyxidicoccus caerfyrddinensis]